MMPIACIFISVYKNEWSCGANGRCCCEFVESGGAMSFAFCFRCDGVVVMWRHDGPLCLACGGAIMAACVTIYAGRRIQIHMRSIVLSSNE